jgi:hypothetical protein
VVTDRIFEVIGNMQTHHSCNAVEWQAPRSGAAGLVPYTTSDTNGSGAASTPFELAAMVQVPAALSRLRRLKHHVRTASRLIRETMQRAGAKWRAVFVTLTYRPGVEWSPRHVTGFLKNVRMWGARQGVLVGYVWVAEMQRRGAVHYHAVIWIPARLQLPKPDRRGWWGHGASNVQAVQRNGVGYLMKYVSKGVGDYPDLPQGARVCGSGGLDAMARDEFHYWRLPRYVRQHVRIGERCRRAEGGGWVSRVTGEVWRSSFGLFGIARRGRGLDCNGRALRDDTVCFLSDRWARRPSESYDWEPIKLALREQEYDENRAKLARLWQATEAGDLAAVWWFWNRAA